MRTVLLTILGFVILVILIVFFGIDSWERYLAPVFDVTLSFLVKVMKYFSTSYGDTIYREAAKGFHERYL